MFAASKTCFALVRRSDIDSKSTKAHLLHQVGFFFDKQNRLVPRGVGGRSSGAEEHARGTRRKTPEVRHQPETSYPFGPPVLRRGRPKPGDDTSKYRRGRPPG
jgi:hypothetical protein